MKNEEKMKLLNEIEDRKQISQNMLEARVEFKWSENGINDKNNQFMIFI